MLSNLLMLAKMDSIRVEDSELYLFTFPFLILLYFLFYFIFLDLGLRDSMTVTNCHRSHDAVTCHTKECRRFQNNNIILHVNSI